MRYLAEFYLPDADIDELTRRTVAAAARAGSTRVLELIVVPADENCFVVFEADGEPDVVAAGARAGLTFDRIAAVRTARLS